MIAPVLPPGSCDCHVHLFGPSGRYPFDPKRVYTPGDADEAALDALHRRIGVDRVVLVQPSVYGTDNRRLVDGLSVLGARARAVAVIADDAPDEALDALHGSGVRGVRVNVATGGRSDPEEVWRRIVAQAGRVARRGWHVQVLTTAPVIAALADRIAALPCPLVIDHFGRPDLGRGPQDADFQAIVSLVRDGRALVKLSSMERLTGPGGLARLASFVRALAEANPRSVVWGSDWPHTGGGRGVRDATEVEPFQPMDDQDALAALLAALPEPAFRRAVLVDNPVRLYRFEEAPA